VSRRPLVLAALALGVPLAGAAPAAASRYVEVKGAPAPGPARYDRVWTDRHGPSRARTVLVLVPGTSGGVGSVAPLAESLVRRVRGLQVWALDRRGNAFEDTSGFRGGDLAKARDYYLGFKFRRTLAADVPWVADWGFATEMNDLRRVIRRASDGGRRRVLLGGHSRGASSAVAYAAWDFGGRAGAKDLDGLVLIDGGLAAFGPRSFSARRAREGLAEIRAGKLFTDPLGSGVPEAGQIFAELVALHARRAPQEPSPIQASPLVPAALRPAFPVTNEAFLGYVFDDSTSPPSFASLQVRAGGLAATGDPRGWVGGQATRIGDLARAFSREPGNAAEWYYPQRLVLDTSAANALRRTPAGDVLGLRLFHTREIALPLYAFQTSLTGGGVLRGARTLIARSRIRRATLIDASATTSHLDPVLGDAMLPTVVPFIRRVVRGG
jgi:hypothetical protein